MRSAQGLCIMTQEKIYIGNKNSVSHKATDVGEITQEKEHAGGDEHRAKLSTTPTCKGWREEKGPGKRKKPGSQWQESQGKEDSQKKGDTQHVCSIKVDEYGKPAPEKATWSLQEARRLSKNREGLG